MLINEPEMDINKAFCKTTVKNIRKRKRTPSEVKATMGQLSKAQQMIAEQCGTEVYKSDCAKDLVPHAEDSEEFRALLRLVTIEPTRCGPGLHVAYRMLLKQPEMVIDDINPRKVVKLSDHARKK